MPHFRHDCMNPHCCRYVGSFSEVTNLYGEPRMTSADVYVYDSLGEEHLNIRIADEGSQYHTTTIEGAERSAKNGNQLYEFALKTYADFCKEGR